MIIYKLIEMTTEKMEEVWKQTPPDILELIADFADIDTRRALCFKPRKLLLPALNINFNSYISNVHWINPSYSIDLGERVRVEFHPTYTAWEFYDGERDNSRHKFYQFSYVLLIIIHSIYLIHYSTILIILLFYYSSIHIISYPSQSLLSNERRLIQHLSQPSRFPLNQHIQHQGV